MAKRKQSRKSKMGIIVAVLLLAVGFAAVTTTLYINGTITIKPDTEDFEKNVIFTDAKLALSDGTTVLEQTATANAGTVTLGAAATKTNDAIVSISADGKTIEFTSEVLDTIGQKNVLTYTVGNFSQYDAKLGTLVCKAFDEAQTFDETNTFADATSKQDTHYSLTVANETENAVLAAKNGTVTGTATGTITVEMIKSYVGTDTSADNKTQYIYCQMPVTAQEATTAASAS